MKRYNTILYPSIQTSGTIGRGARLAVYGNSPLLLPCRRTRGLREGYHSRRVRNHERSSGAEQTAEGRYRDLDRQLRLDGQLGRHDRRPRAKLDHQCQRVPAPCRRERPEADLIARLHVRRDPGPHGCDRYAP